MESDHQKPVHQTDNQIQQKLSTVSHPESSTSQSKKSEPMDIEHPQRPKEESHPHVEELGKHISNAVLKEKWAKSNDFKFKILCDMETYFNKKLYSKMNSSIFNIFSVIDQEDQDRKRFTQLFKESKQPIDPQILKLTPRQSRAMAAIIGNAIGDALGASTEFEYFDKKGLGIIKNGFADIELGIMNGTIHARHGKVGIWTDDNSMALCMADSVLLTDYQFIPQHIRYMFVMWLEHGLNNGGRPHSIGLGGNISISMGEFMNEQTDYAVTGDRFNNGNGSLMRLSPIPIAFSDDLEKGMLYSGLQSRTTHNGLEAQHCARLMAKIIIQLVNRKEGVDPKQMLLEICDNYQTQVQSVKYLARGKQQSEQLYKKSCQANRRFQKFNKTIQDRNWNWRDANHTYSPCRNKQQPGYIGSYCMDALSMALHTVLFTSSFKEVVVVNADMGGDCDTVGAIAGQIAGAMYGIDKQMMRLYSEMVDWKEGRYEVFLKAYKLANKKKLGQK